jgi:hypothetical protein
MEGERSDITEPLSLYGLRLLVLAVVAVRVAQLPRAR